MDKTNCTVSHKPQKKDKLPLKLPIISINNYEIERSFSKNFLRVMIDEHLSWNHHINILGNKLWKGLGLLHKTKEFLNRKPTASPYHSSFYSYLTYKNIAWCRTTLSKSKRFTGKQRQAIKRVLIERNFWKN